MKDWLRINILLSVLGHSLFVHVTAQEVNFTPHDDLLQTITGFANYADCVVDMNGDYLDDVVRIGSKGVFIDFQQLDGSFTFRQYHLPIQSPPSWSICAGDIDNNGYNDLLLASGNFVSFIKANKEGTAYQEELMPGFIECQRSTMQDINQDGWLDGFVCFESGQSVPYRNLGHGEMMPDSTLLPTSPLPGNYAAIWTDYDNDADSDLYISKCWATAIPGDPERTNLLYRNNGDDSYTEVGAVAGLDDNAQSWSTVFEDFDMDGDFDAFIVNHDFANRLFRNNGDGTFTDVIAVSGINPLDLGAFENASGDFNNDGFADIFAELQTPLYLGHGDLTFSGRAAPVFPGSIGDLNNDGYLDIVKGNRVWLNAPNTNHWVKINTLGLISNRNGIGARIELYGPWGVQVREVRSGQSFSPMSSLTTHFGLGSQDHIDSLIIQWPSGIRTRSMSLQADTTYLIPETPCLLSGIQLETDSVLRICPGDTIEIEAPPGFSGYSWSNGDTTSVARLHAEGSYYLLAQDSAGCHAVSNFFRVEVQQDVQPVINSPAGLYFCDGDTLILTASPGNAFLWSTGDTTQSIAIHEGGTYSVTIDAVCSPGTIASAPITIDPLFPTAPVTTTVILPEGDSALLQAFGENIHWYDQEVGGTLLHIGSTYQTPILNQNTTYFLESHVVYGGHVEQGGKPDTAGGGGLPTQSGSLSFIAHQPFTLHSVEVYIPEGGPLGVRFVQLISHDSVIAFKQFNMDTGKNILDLGFKVGVGRFILKCPQGNLFRNTGTLDYPYPIGSVGWITGSSHGDNYYYDFYNWTIQSDTLICISDRIALDVLITADEVPEENTFQLFPNPTHATLYIQSGFPIPDATIKILDIHGRLVQKAEWNRSQTDGIDVSALPGGMYVLHLVSNHQFLSSCFVHQPYR